MYHKWAHLLSVVNFAAADVDEECVCAPIVACFHTVPSLRVERHDRNISILFLKDDTQDVSRVQRTSCYQPAFPLERVASRFGGAEALAANLFGGLIPKFDVSKSCRARTDWLDSAEACRSDSAFSCGIPSSVSVSHEYQDVVDLSKELR